MVRTILVVGVALVSVSAAHASEAPWCAVNSGGDGDMHWDCQYRSFEECYRNGNVLAGNRGFCNPSPYYVANAAGDTRSAKRRARPQ
jgi:hypothetical protein